MRLRAVIAAILLACLGLVALAGRGGEPLAPEAAIAQAASRAAAAGSFRVSIVATGAGFRAQGSGAVDTERSRGTLTFGFERPAMTTEIVYGGRFMYVRSPAIADVLPGAKPWLQTPLIDDEPSDDAFDVLESFSHAPLHDPASMLDFLRATSGRVEELGSERVRDVETTHYRATVDLDRAAAEATGFEREKLQLDLELRREHSLPTRWPIEVWIGDDGLARRLRTEEQADGATSVFTIDFFDYGNEVEITLPPEEEVMTSDEFSELLAKGPSCSDGANLDEPAEPYLIEEPYLMDETTESEVPIVAYCVFEFE